MENYVIVGGAAAAYHSCLWAEVRPDLDIIADYDTGAEFLRSAGEVVSIIPYSGTKLVGHYRDRTPIEVDIAWEGSSSRAILDYCLGQGLEIAPLEVLLMMKLSHRYKKNSPHFWKTVTDIHRLRGITCIYKDKHLGEPLLSILRQREKETYDYSHPKLNVRKQDFFNGDGVQYIVDHDWIHTQVQLFDRPAYTMFGVPGEEVLSSKERFFTELSDEERLAAVMEESMVLAIERSLLPHPEKLTPEQAYKLALEKVCTSITSGWFREYAWENCRAALDELPLNHFLTAIEKVKNHVRVSV